MTEVDESRCETDFFKKLTMNGLSQTTLGEWEVHLTIGGKIRGKDIQTEKIYGVHSL